MANNRMLVANGIFAAVMTLYATLLWAEEHQTSFPGLQMSTQEALGSAWFILEKERSFIPQSSWLLFPPREWESTSFKHDSITAAYKQTAKSVLPTSPGGIGNTRPGGIPIHDLVTGGIPILKW